MLSRSLRIEFQAVLDTTQTISEVGPARKGAFGSLIQCGRLCTNDMQRKQVRNLVKPFFAQGYLNDLGSTERYIEMLLMAIPMEDNSGWIMEVDLLESVLIQPLICSRKSPLRKLSVRGSAT